ncbi:diaminopropionate ammonia-lyase [Salipiger aestuarii]|uniref:Diaminopropionate ammonia-lyase n=1 Tax=Salipiger aestuarii TaxID=568098 RepID=A0A327Y6Z7_9RHOB|nr:diaminopropionate ammonia-lyase [Salipiger aestuarii]KAA8608362.1 diaminopropionate ammonia-lyase [Salipiger aestuarii]KAB2542170.1 diaminopropionate ammonia-lyase [Salipiger aestuarii]RAK16860.1 diaminopropionate ammonia-lyase [Salipiger aestuarii]
MSTDITRGAGTDAAFTLVMNPLADRGAAWTEAQNAILSDKGLDLARHTIAGWPGHAPTPLVNLPALAASLGVADLRYKDEGGRFGLGSFKALGGAYAVARLLAAEIGKALGRDVTMDEVASRAHPDEAARISVCCATDGNHGRSVAWGARNFGCKCNIFIHASVSQARKSAIESYGATVIRCAGNYDDSVRAAQQQAGENGWFVVSDTSYAGYMDIPRDVMQGYEVMAAEAFDAMDTVPTHVFLQTGVGGMAAAVAAQAVRRWGAARPVIILCDPDRSACWVETIRAGKPTAVGGDLDTLMAGLACGEVSALAWDILRTHGDAVMALCDAAAVSAMRLLARPESDPPIVAGESAVAGLAGLIAAMGDDDAKASLGLDGTSRVMVFGTEGDTDAALYHKLVGATGDAVRAGTA